MKKERTLATIALLMAGTLIAKFLGFFREILFAYQFGAGEISDAFMLVRELPDVLFGAVALAINFNFIPIYVSNRNIEARRYFVSNLISVCLVFSCIGSLLLNIFPRQIIWLFATSFPEKTVAYAIIMLRIISLALAPIVLGCIFQSYSQINGRFFSTAVTGIITNVIVIVVILVSSQDTFYFLSMGEVLAHLSLMLVLWFSAKKSGLQYSKVLNFGDPSLREMGMLTLPVLAEHLAWDFSVVVDRNIGSYLGVGIIANMAYGQLFAWALGVIASNAIATVAFPKLSKLAADGDSNAFLSLFIRCFRLLQYLVTPASVFILLFSNDITGLFFGHGAIQASDVKIIAECASCYALGILPICFKRLYVQGFYTFKNTKLPMYAGVSAFLCNMILSILCAHVWGYIGVAVSTSISFLIACILLEIFFNSQYKMSVFRNLRMDFLIITLLSIVSWLLTYWMVNVCCITNSLIERVFFEGSLFFGIYIFLFFIVRRDLFGEVIFWVRER